MYYKNYTYETYVCPQQMRWGGRIIKIDSATLSVEDWSKYYITVETRDKICINDFNSEPDKNMPVIAALQEGEQRLFHPVIVENNMWNLKNNDKWLVKFRVKPALSDDGHNYAGELWEAFISGMTVDRSDGWTHVETRSALDTVSFIVNGKNWAIKTPVAETDGVVPVEKASSNFKLSKDKVLIQAPANMYDFNEFYHVSSNIATILSIGIGSVAHIEQFSKRTRTNERILYKLQSFSRRPMGSWGALRQTIQPGMIRRFIETAYPVYCLDPKWWNITAHWYTNLTMCGEIDGGNFYMALLFDRIFHHLKSTEYNRMEQWAIRENVKWNNKKDLNFIYKLKYLANRFKVDIPADEFKQIRNKLVHEGEPDLNYPHNMQVHEACLNALTSILLQMLNYNGGFYERSYAKAKPIFI